MTRNGEAAFDVRSITNVTLIDGTGAPPVEGATIIVHDGRIESIERDATAPDEGGTLDGSGLWAVPGLIDTHVHLELVSRDALPVFLATGVTTIRDLGGALDFLVETRQMLEDGLTGPRLLFTGPMLDGREATWQALVRTTADADDATRAVDEHLAAGADAIKLYTTMTSEVVQRCIEHVAGRVPVTGHLAYTKASTAMAAGINGLEHALLTPYNDFAPEELRTSEETMMSPGYWGNVLRGWLAADLAGDKARRWYSSLAEHDVSFCPTLTVLPGAGDAPEPEELRFVPKVEERWLEATSQREAQPAPPETQQIALRVRERLQELVRRTHEAGGRIVTGTDTGAIRSLVPGFALHREIGFLVQAGLSNMAALHAATGRAAEALRRSDIGTVEAGKQADVLLLGSDPLVDVRALRDIKYVIQSGTARKPEDLLT